MKLSDKLSARTRWRLLAIVGISLLAVVALAATVPSMLIGPVDGSLAGY